MDVLLPKFSALFLLRAQESSSKPQRHPRGLQVSQSRGHPWLHNLDALVPFELLQEGCSGTTTLPFAFQFSPGCSRGQGTAVSVQGRDQLISDQPYLSGRGTFPHWPPALPNPPCCHGGARPRGCSLHLPAGTWGRGHR